METFGNQNYAKLCAKYYCNNCNYVTSRKSSYDNHLLSAKHKKCIIINVLETFGNNNMQELYISKYSCKKCNY